MADDKIRSKADDRPEHVGREQGEQQVQESQASAPVQSERRVASGRMPLFRR